ncbi:hypothetical protein FNH09_10470 [Streptomyces adustus]|uniref:Uncharacterized protein n=1 Tax=Streptomyces adustus TaxID=1609272 RepID=A0A5N8V8Z3_9ACTN|nr:hypothetical protein [Streptomyces adustus]
MPTEVEQVGKRRSGQALSALPAVMRTAGSGATPGAAPAWLVPGTTRIPHKVPEQGADSGP